MQPHSQIKPHVMLKVLFLLGVFLMYSHLFVQKLIFQNGTLGSHLSRYIRSKMEQVKFVCVKNGQKSCQKLYGQK